MDAAPLPQRDARRCARPGCNDVAQATLTFRYDLQQAWVLPLTEEASPATYDLCGPCADKTRPPRGWGLVDERPDLDGLAELPDEHDVVRAAIAAALRGQQPAPSSSTPGLEAVPDPAPGIDDAPAATSDPAPTEAPSLRAVPDLPGPRPRTPAPALVAVATPRSPEPASAPIGAAATTVAGDVDLVAALRAHQEASPVEDVAAPTEVARERADREPAPADPEVSDADAEATDARTGGLRVAPPTGPRRRSPVSVLLGREQEADDDDLPVHPVQAAALELLVAGVGDEDDRHLRATELRAADLPTFGPRGADDRPAGQAVAVPLAFDEVPERFVSLGLDDLGDFDEADLLAGLRGPDLDLD